MMNLSPKQRVIASVLSYSFCSGSLLLINKLTLHFLPFPSLVICFQLAACIFLIYGAKIAGYLDVDDFVWEHVKPYLLFISFFSAGVYCNMRSLNVSNVETVIVFRALTPLVVSLLDSLFLGREWPSPRSSAGLILLVMGAYGYASFDEEFQTQGVSAYSWPAMYTIIVSLEMAYGKKIVKSVPLKTLSGPVIYTNVIGFIPMLMLANVSNEYSRFWDFFWNDIQGKIPAAAMILLAVGSCVGTGIGYSGWWCRDCVSATSFALVGVMNKCLTVLLNTLIWDQHAKPGGTFCLFICLMGGMLYKQAPLRSERKTPLPVTAEDEEFKAEIGSEVPSTKKEVDMETIALTKQSGNTKRRGPSTV